MPSLAEIEAAERRLGPSVRLPDDHREWLMTMNGVEGWFGDVFVMLYTLDEIVSVTEAAEAEERLPDFVAVGSDGSREIIAYDFRRSPPPLVMVDMVAESWADGLPQAPSLSEFMAQRERREPFVWNGTYS
jgi:hypothetical protein